MTISRRAFLGSLGVGAAALAFGGVSLPATGTLSVEATTDAAAVLDQALRIGDTFTIAGRYAVHPITRQATEHLCVFVVTAIEGSTVTCTPASNAAAGA